MTPVSSIEVEADKGIAGNGRYFDRRRSTGGPGKRQVTLIEREQIDAHGKTLGISIEPGVVRSNIETKNIDLIALVGRQVRVGTVVLEFYEARTPCAKMDVVCRGLRAEMEHQRQGVLARVIQSGRIRAGDSIRPDPVTG